MATRPAKGLSAAFGALRVRAAGLAADLVLLLPAIGLGGLAFGVEGAAITAAAVAPVLLSLRLAQAVRRTPGAAMTPAAPLAAQGARGVAAMLDMFLSGAVPPGRMPACLVVAIDDARELADRIGASAFDDLMARAAERLSGALRESDLVAVLGSARFAVALAPAPRSDLEALIQVASRLQAALAVPFSIDAASVNLSASVGFCLGARAPSRGGEALLTAAEHAAEEARKCGPGAIRAYTPELDRQIAGRAALAASVAEALENGEIVAHFQPQLSTDTGEISGFEALARWQHPDGGLIAPSEFLPAIDAAGLSGRLTEIIIFHALTAMRAWDRAGFRVPSIAVNFSRADLRDARLPEKLKWELDRFELPPERFTAEILETVVAETDDDVAVRNIAALARIGVGIDLDDFGTGHASIANIRRFAVRRIKIDRSFVMRCDSDPSQQRMLSAILSMAERLQLETLAEGVETHGEHAMLAQLGCTCVQGFAIARPMPFAETIGWMERHKAKLAATPRIGRKTG